MGRRDFVPPFCCLDFDRRLAKPQIQRPSPRLYTYRIHTSGLRFAAKLDSISAGKAEGGLND
ncbi:hypothetical protein, partial [Mesorhizobium sp. M1329]|uniref:hypothetical protein n=1 Tax=Mesorhizobium sp. M1329 TaxID=2957083 RepID=UPI00333DF338